MRRAIDELRRLPQVDPESIRRVVNAAAAARLSPADEPVFVPAESGRSVRLWSALSLAAAAAVVGFVARGAWTSGKRSSVVPSAAQTIASVASAPVTPIADAADPRPILQQFVFDNPGAHRVAVVGDFNKWNPSKTLMTRSSATAPWSVIVPILPGRHIYGYMVDDSVFTLDPRAPQMRDADLGTAGSVVIVGRP